MSLELQDVFQQFGLAYRYALYQTEWVVYCKKPFKSPWHVLRYLGRYTHRVAISNQRIVSLQDNAGAKAPEVTFSWRDYKDKSKTKLMTLETSEFIRRFLSD